MLIGDSCLIVVVILVVLVGDSRSGVGWLDSEMVR